MAEDIIEDLDDDFDDAMADILDDDSLEDNSEDILDNDSEDILDDDSEDVLDDDSEDFQDEDLEDISGEDTVEKSGGKFSKEAITAKVKDIISQLSGLVSKVPIDFSKLPIDINQVKKLVQIITGSVRNLIIAGVSFVIFIVLVFTIALFLFGGEPEEIPEDLHPVVNQETGESELLLEEEIIFEEIVELEPFERISLRTSTTMGLVSINLALELFNPEDRRIINSSQERIRQIITGQVGNMTWLELRNPDGKILLKYNLLRRINAMFPEPVVRNVYFTYFIMQ